MPMINDPGSLPDPMWVLARYLATAKETVPSEQARAALTPAVLLGEAQREKDETFDRAVRTLQDLRLVEAQGDRLGLTDGARACMADLATYTHLLRRAVLTPDLNAGLGDSGSQSGPRDLVRALAWFLTQDPLGTPLGWQEVSVRQVEALSEHVGPAIINKFRWDRFCYWAPALGLATPPLIGGDDPGGRKLIPDCTTAVKQAVLSRWDAGQRVDALEVVAGLREEIPVLPGGHYSQVLGLPASAPGQREAPSLSHALLRGHDEGWIRLEPRSDAAREVLLADPDNASGTRRVADIVMVGDRDG